MKNIEYNNMKFSERVGSLNWACKIVLHLVVGGTHHKILLSSD